MKPGRYAAADSYYSTSVGQYVPQVCFFIPSGEQCRAVELSQTENGGNHYGKDK